MSCYPDNSRRVYLAGLAQGGFRVRVLRGEPIVLVQNLRYLTNSITRACVSFPEATPQISYPIGDSPLRNRD